MSDGTRGRCHRRKYPSQEKSAVNTPYQENAQTLSSDQLTLSQNMHTRARLRYYGVGTYLIGFRVSNRLVLCYTQHHLALVRQRTPSGFIFISYCSFRNRNACTVHRVMSTYTVHLCGINSCDKAVKLQQSPSF